MFRVTFKELRDKGSAASSGNDYESGIGRIVVEALVLVVIHHGHDTRGWVVAREPCLETVMVNKSESGRGEGAGRSAGYVIDTENIRPGVQLGEVKSM